MCNRCYLRTYRPVPTDLSHLLLAGEQAKKPKGKAKRSRSGEISDGIVEDHEADSELASGAAVDITGYPLRIRVECSPIERVNGIYSRAADLTNGKPYYNFVGSKKLTQLFLHGKEWKLGKINEAGFFAKVKAVKAHTLPIEPYPFVWKVLPPKSESKETQDAPAMRVIDLDPNAPCLPAAADLPAQHPLAATRSDHRKRRRTGDEAPGGSAAAKRTKKGKPTNRDGLTDSKDAKSEEDSEDESGSESDSESSSSSSGSDKSSGTAPSPKAKAMTVTEVEVTTEANPDPNKAGLFKEKLRSALKKATTKQCRAKLHAIAMNRQRYTQVSGMTHDDLMVFVDRMYKEHGKPLPRPPPGEPPRHLLERAGHSLPAPASAVCADAPAQRKSASTTMAELDPEDLMPHRHPQEREPKKGCLQGVRVGKFHPEAKRISFFDSGSGDGYEYEKPRVEIASMRGYLQHLWFQQPGAMVHCDMCEQEVPQSCGCFLGGAPGSSQFAQTTFVCQGCM